MKRLIFMSAIVVATLSASVVCAAPQLGGPLVDGSVVRAHGCGSHFFIVYRNEYALAELLGGEMVKDGEVLQTTDDQESFEREGRMTLTNLVTGRIVDVVIEQALINTTDYSRTARKFCR
jgi:hypothetical protein